MAGSQWCDVARKCIWAAPPTNAYNITVVLSVTQYDCSAIGSLVYSYIKYAEQQEKKSQGNKQKQNGQLIIDSSNKDIEAGLVNDNPPIPPHLK